jgi:hypothetical protein
MLLIVSLRGMKINVRAAQNKLTRDPTAGAAGLVATTRQIPSHSEDHQKSESC